MQVLTFELTENLRGLFLPQELGRSPWVMEKGVSRGHTRADGENLLGTADLTFLHARPSLSPFLISFLRLFPKPLQLPNPTEIHKLFFCVVRVGLFLLSCFGFFGFPLVKTFLD